MEKQKRRWPWQRARDETSVQASTAGASLTPANWTNLNIGTTASLKNDTIYAAVTRISGALSTMPLKLYKGYEEATDDPLYWLMRLRPNPRMSASMFFKALEGYRLTEGRAYAVKRLDAFGNLRELEIVDPSAVTPLIEKESGALWYSVRRNDGEVEYLHSFYVLSAMHMSLDGLRCIRPVDVLRNSLQYAEDIRTFSLDAVKSVNKGIVLQFPTTLSGERRARAVQEFLNLYRESGGQVIALEAGVQYARLDGSPIDGGLQDVEKITRGRTATVYNLPPHLLGDYSDATAASIEQQNIEFLVQTMSQILEMYQQEFDYKLLTPEKRKQGYHFRFDIDAFLRADASAQSKRDQSAIRTGIRTVNELRAREGYAPVEGGDTAMVSKDLAPVRMVAAGATITLDEINGAHNSGGETDE